MLALPFAYLLHLLFSLILVSYTLGELQILLVPTLSFTNTAYYRNQKVRRTESIHLQFLPSEYQSQ